MWLGSRIFQEPGLNLEFFEFYQYLLKHGHYRSKFRFCSLTSAMLWYVIPYSSNSICIQLLLAVDRPQSQTLSLPNSSRSRSSVTNSRSDIDTWLRSLQLSRYSDHFRQAGITSVDAVRRLSPTDLASIGVTSSDHRHILLNAARRLDLRYVWPTRL